MSEASNEPISREERIASQRLYNAVIVLLSMHSRMTVQMATAFLHVAAKEEQTVAELAAKCEVSAAVMSRHLRNLGGINRHNRAGLELVVLVQRVHGDRRERRAVLTERGIRAAQLMITALTEKTPRRVGPRPRQPLV